jgi:hypothetical protein
MEVKQLGALEEEGIAKTVNDSSSDIYLIPE